MVLRWFFDGSSKDFRGFFVLYPQSLLAAQATEKLPRIGAVTAGGHNSLYTRKSAGGECTQGLSGLKG
jgi:hypothetical protein